jgi:hypothetical protein
VSPQCGTGVWLELFVYCGPVRTKLKWSITINEHTLYVQIIISVSFRIAKINLPLALLSPDARLRNYSDVNVDPEELFADFDNETGVSEYIIPNYVHFVLFDQAGKLDFTSFLCILAAVKIHQPSDIFLHSNSPLYAGKNNQSRYSSK